MQLYIIEAKSGTIQLSPRKILFFIIILCCSMAGSQLAIAQNRSSNKDSLAAVRKQQQEAEKAKETAAKEKAKQQQQKQDSITAARKQNEKAKEAAAKEKAIAQEAQRKQQEKSRDSLAKARAKETAARQAQQKRYTDSLKASRQRSADSIAKIRKRRTDSLTAIRKYKESKRYTDSVEKARMAKAKALQTVRLAKLDSAKAVRKKTTDSAIAIRKKSMDSVRAIQKKRTDSLTARRKYRESKRFADSVAVVKKMRMDSITKKRKIFNDSLAKGRKAKADSFAKLRKAKTDSLAKTRKVKTDSLAGKRKLSSDSLAKVKEKREKALKAKEKEREQKQQLAFELKIKKKQKAYTNEKMLKKRWSVPRRIVQNTFTHYNYYFNADRKMDEAIANMLRTKKDNYDSLLALFPFNPDKDSAMLSADMDSIIYKASIGIQLHDPRTKWGDDLYLLLGQAYYYKGNYKEASAAFRYELTLRDKKRKPNDNSSVYTKKAGKELSIAQKDKKVFFDFLKHHTVHNEALLWLSRTYTQMKQEGNAESVLDLLETDPNFPKELQGRLALEKAFIYLQQNDRKAAADQLVIAANDRELPDWVQMRAAFIAGQIQQSRGEYAASAASFKKVIDLNPKIEMDFQARKNMANSLMYAGGDQGETIASLKKVLKDGKYTPYYEQVYYVLGRLSANAGNNEDAISYLSQGLQSSRTTPKQKVLSYATLGGIYYNAGRYVDAKSAYDSAAALANVLPNDSLALLAVKRSMALTSITNPLLLIKTNDSLIALGMMSDKDMRAEVRKYIRKLEQQRADSIFKAENPTAQGGGGGAGNTNNGGDKSNPYTNWYFANPVLVQQGINEFKRKWGNRQLADNWRRSAAASGNSSATNNTNTTANAEDDIERDENGLPTEEALIALIPKNEEAIEELRFGIRRAYMDVANAYVKDLEDYPPAIKNLDTLNKRFPNHEHKAEELYVRYLIAIRQNRLEDAKRYANDLITLYPNSKWAPLVKPSESKGMAMVTDEEVARIYEETYNMVLDRQCDAAMRNILLAKTNYSNPRYTKRYTILEGLTLACMKKHDEADTLVRQFISSYPKDSLRPWADAVLKYIQDSRPKISGGSPITGEVKAGGSAADTSAASKAPIPKMADATGMADVPATPIPAAYTYKQVEEHYVMFVFGATDQRSSGVKAAMSDFNSFKFNELKLTTDQTPLTSSQSIITTKSFRNLAAARIYINSLRATGQIFREYQQSEYQIIPISATNYIKLVAEKDMKAYLQFYNANYK
ncbi:hypothetical protein CAP35_12100 [Chitinophagaceae bacterium IBVUCB1]|nr:hypothetical protein CAP35_12100 [Chitinophagaceae bacterium IBVUCB1]